MSGAPPQLHDLALPAVQPVSPMTTFVYRFETKPKTPESEAFMASMRKYSSLCRNGELYFKHGFVSSGTLWMLHKDHVAAESNYAPHIAHALAFAFTDTDTTGNTVFDLEYLCATPRSPRGSGKVLFDVIVRHAAATGFKKLVLIAAEKELEAVYTGRFGMDCGGFVCTLKLDGFRQVYVPKLASVSLHDLETSDFKPPAAAAAKPSALRAARKRAFVSDSDSDSVSESDSSDTSDSE